MDRPRCEKKSRVVAKPYVNTRLNCGKGEAKGQSRKGSAQRTNHTQPIAMLN